MERSCADSDSAARDFMGRADAIVVSLPLADDTGGMVGAAELAAMRPGAVIVNVGRGPVIDQQALFDALSQRRIEAVIDTWYDYPTRDNPHTQPGRLPFNQLDQPGDDPAHERLDRRHDAAAAGDDRARTSAACHAASRW